MARSSHLISHGLSLGDSCVESPAETASPAEGLGHSPGREQRLGSGEKGQGSLVSGQQNPVGEGLAAALRHPTSETLMPQRDRNTPPEGEGETEGTGADVGAMVSVCLLRQTHGHHLTPCDSPFGVSFLGTALLFGDPHGNREKKKTKGWKSLQRYTAVGHMHARTRAHKHTNTHKGSHFVRSKSPGGQGKTLQSEEI